MTASLISSAMDSNSDFGVGGSDDDDASFTQAHEEEEQQQDENIATATVTPTTQKREMVQIQFTREALHSLGRKDVETLC